MIAISTETTADLSLQELSDLGIHTVSVNVVHDGRTHLDGSLTPSELMTIVEHSGRVASSVVPGVAEYTRTFHRLLSQHDEIIHVTNSSQLSQCMQSALTAAQGVRTRVTVIDSGNGSYGVGLMAKRAAELVASGASTPDIVRHLEDMRPKVRLYLAVPDLKFLQLNGRISGLASFIGGVLKTTPILAIRRGVFEGVGRPRGGTRAISELVDLAAQDARGGRMRVHYVYTAGGSRVPSGETGALRLQQQLRSQYPDSGLHPLGIGVCANTGPGVFGMVTEVQ